jgi:predicted secreted protein
VLSIVTGSINQATASIQFQTASLLTFTASQDSRNFTLSQVTGSFRGEIGGLEDYSASLKAAAIVSSSTQVQNYDIFGLNSNLYRATGSLIGITNGLMAFTASLDNTYATDAQLYQLYQATRSIELTTGSLIGITNGLMAFTASEDSRNLTLSQVTGSFRGELGGLEAYSASLKGAAIVSSSTQVQNYDVFALNSKLYTVTGSLIGITNGLMAFTAALDSTYATDAQLFQLYQATRSIELTTGSLIGITNALMAFTAALDSTYATDAQLYQLYAETASMKSEIAGIESYTASLKAAAIVSSSQQIIDYNTFAVTSSANTFYGNQTISGSLRVNGPVRGNTISGGLDVNGGITGSVKGNLVGVADYASTIVVTNSGTTTDTSLFPTFTLSPVLASYTSLYSHASSSFFFNGVTRRLHMEGFVVSGSNNIAEISGSLNVTGSITINSGSISMPNRPAFRVVGTASTDRVAQTTLSGSYTSIDYNEGNYYNNSTGIFTAPIAGLYQIYYNGRCGSVNAQQQVIIYKNGVAGTTQLMWEAPGNTGVAHFGVSGIAKLAVNDTLEVKIAIGSIQFDGNDSWGAAYIG